MNEVMVNIFTALISSFLWFLIQKNIERSGKENSLNRIKDILNDKERHPSTKNKFKENLRIIVEQNENFLTNTPFVKINGFKIIISEDAASRLYASICCFGIFLLIIFAFKMSDHKDYFWLFILFAGVYMCSVIINYWFYKIEIDLAENKLIYKNLYNVLNFHKEDYSYEIQNVKKIYYGDAFVGYIDVFQSSGITKNLVFNRGLFKHGTIFNELNNYSDRVTSANRLSNFLKNIIDIIGGNATIETLVVKITRG